MEVSLPAEASLLTAGGAIRRSFRSICREHSDHKPKLLIYNFPSLHYLLLILLILTSPVSALSSFDKRTIDESFLEPPQIRNPKLNTRVKFSFHKTPLSDILLVLSRQADFNLVLPDRFDQKLSIQIKNQRIIDAIDDITALAGLTYRFHSNSLIVSSKENQGQFFESVPVIHYSATKLAKTLNEVFFANLIIAQDASRMIPNAVADPSKNSLILFGDEEQIAAARKFIEQHDLPPRVKIYQPKFIKLTDAERLLTLFINPDHNLKLEQYGKEDILIKGPGEELAALLKVFKKYDHEPKPIDLRLEVYALERRAKDLYNLVNENYKKGSLYLLNSSDYKADEFKELLNCMNLILTEEFSLARGINYEMAGLEFSGQRILFDTKHFDLKAMGNDFAALDEKKQILKILNAHELNTYYELKSLLEVNHEQLVWIVLKAI